MEKGDERGSCVILCFLFGVEKVACAHKNRVSVWKSYSPQTSFTFLTYLTVGAQVPGAGTITYVAVPALLAQPSIATRSAAAALLKLPRAEAAHAQRTLDLSQPADVAALAVDEEVADAAHVAVVQQRRPDLGRQDEVGLKLRQPAQEHVTVQVQDFTALWGAEGHAAAVYRDRSYKTETQILYNVTGRLDEIVTCFLNSVDEWKCVLMTHGDGNVWCGWVGVFVGSRVDEWEGE